MKVNLKMDRDMEKVNRSGRMVVFMKATGVKIKLMGKVGWFIRTEIIILVNGLMIRRKDKVYIWM